MKRIITLLLVLLSGYSYTQIGMGQWRLHIPATKATDVVECNKKIYTAYSNGLSEYDLDAQEISVWDVITGLSDITISSIGTDGSRIFIGYENGNLDFIKDNAA